MSTLSYIKIIAGIGVLSMFIWIYSSKLDQQYRAGFLAGKSSAELACKEEKQQAIEILNSKVANLVAANQKVQDEKAKLNTKIHNFAKRDADKSRLREQTELKFSYSISEATAENLRRYAETCDRNTTGFREDIKRFGLEAAECSRTAEIQRRDLDNWQKILTGEVNE